MFLGKAKIPFLFLVSLTRFLTTDILDFKHLEGNIEYPPPSPSVLEETMFNLKYNKYENLKKLPKIVLTGTTIK